eukprot:5691915-Alexandrium_andersonii.AAC.1
MPVRAPLSGIAKNATEAFGLGWPCFPHGVVHGSREPHAIVSGVNRSQKLLQEAELGCARP